jgi:hypothetical protein
LLFPVVQYISDVIIWTPSRQMPFGCTDNERGNRESKIT